ncbi:hypothetical protein GCM10009740_21320 [Terrabacter terrae]|uniref:Response regulatory domain-containing protein n=1 Tax=Terrabacter terrae TaxID=318434 RepID=A0ABN2UET2_9MICO
MLSEVMHQILVVEDDDGIALPLLRTLDREGYAVERVATGAAGLERAARGTSTSSCSTSASPTSTVSTCADSCAPTATTTASSF